MTGGTPVCEMALQATALCVRLSGCSPLVFEAAAVPSLRQPSIRQTPVSHSRATVCAGSADTEALLWVLVHASSGARDISTPSRIVELSRCASVVALLCRLSAFPAVDSAH